jgi:pimeloyl-ACP methyl ester carboxylesterase
VTAPAPRWRPRSLPALLRRRRAARYVPAPPIDPPPGRIVHVPGRGEFFLRDSGDDRPALLLLHGWMVSADLNWITAYDALIDAGYRVLALDHRGHGRDLRSPERFRLTDCADDAAAILRNEGIDRVVAVGYSMGGPSPACSRATTPTSSPAWSCARPRPTGRSRT